MSSRLDYCNSVLAGLLEGDIRKLQCVQNAAANLVTHSKKYDNITPVLVDLHWLPVRSRILYKVLVLTYHALEGTAPPYIQSLLSLHPQLLVPLSLQVIPLNMLLEHYFLWC